MYSLLVAEGCVAVCSELLVGMEAVLSACLGVGLALWVFSGYWE